MPIYEYKCENGHVFDVMQRMSEDPLVTCQSCDAPVHRVFHPVAVHFKGSGFYNTDYGTRRRQREMKESGESAGSSNGASSSTDGAKTSEAATSTSSSSSSSSTSSSSSPSKSSD